MKKLYKEFTITSGGGTIALKANDLNNYYMVTGNAVTITSGLTFTIDTPSKNCPVRIYWNQPVSIGAGGAITILGNAITDYDKLDSMILDLSYDGTSWKLINVTNLSVSTLSKPIWNQTVTVNYDMTVNDPTRKIFKSYADAVVYILTQTPTTTDQWAVYLPSGYCNEDMLAYKFINIMGVAGTKIKSLTSTVVTATGVNIFDCTVYGCMIDVYNVAANRIINFSNCIFNNYIPVPAAANGYVNMNDCVVFKGDFSNTSSVLEWNKNEFIGLLGDIDLSSLSFAIVSSTIKDSANTVSLPKLTQGGVITIGTRTIDYALSILNSNVNFTSITFTVAPYLRLSLFTGDTLELSDGCKITNCSIFLDDIICSGGFSVFYDSEVKGTKTLSNAATLDFHTCQSVDGNIELNDTAVLKLYGANEIDGNIVINDITATVEDYGAFYDNTISGLAADNTKEAIDELKTTADGLLTDDITVAGEWAFTEAPIMGTSAEVAAAANVGKIRYRADANNSWCEMVMQTGAATYAWVVIKTNNW